MQQWAVPGLAYVVVRDDRIVDTGAFGVREYGRGDLVDLDTVFGWGSITKTFTAGAVCALVDEGRLKWSDRVVDWLPDFRLRDPWIAANATIWHLATHTLGVDSDAPWMMQSWGIEATAAHAADLKGQVLFGQFQYSNVGMTVLGAVCAAAAGIPWRDVVRTRLLEPLKMTRSDTGEDTFVAADSLAKCWLCLPPEGARVGEAALRSGFENYAAPHGVPDDSMAEAGARGEVEVFPWRFESSVAPAGTVNGSAHDLARWMRMHLNAGVVDGVRVLSPTQVAATHSLQAVIPSPPIPADGELRQQTERVDGMGLGWRVKIYRGHRASVHAGGQVGFGSIIWVFPDANLGVAVLANLDYRHHPVFQVLARQLMDHHLGLPPLAWDRYYGERWTPAHEGRAIALPDASARVSSWPEGDRLTGAWTNPTAGDLKIERERDALVARFDPRALADVLPDAAGRFVLRFRSAERWRMRGALIKADDSADDVLELEGSAEGTAPAPLPFRRGG